MERNQVLHGGAADGAPLLCRRHAAHTHAAWPGGRQEGPGPSADLDGRDNEQSGLQSPACGRAAAGEHTAPQVAMDSVKRSARGATLSRYLSPARAHAGREADAADRLGVDTVRGGAACREESSTASPEAMKHPLRQHLEPLA